MEDVMIRNKPEKVSEMNDLDKLMSFDDCQSICFENAKDVVSQFASSNKEYEPLEINYKKETQELANLYLQILNRQGLVGY